MTSTHHSYPPTNSQNSMKQPYHYWSGKSVDLSIMQQLNIIGLLILGTNWVARHLLLFYWCSTLVDFSWHLKVCSAHTELELSSAPTKSFSQLQLAYLPLTYEHSLDFANDLVRPCTFGYVWVCPFPNPWSMSSIHYFITILADPYTSLQQHNFKLSLGALVTSYWLTSPCQSTNW